MTVFHFFNCAILTFGPHAVYYSATPLSEYDTLGTSVKAALVYLGTALVKLVCLATFLKVSDNESFDPYQMNSGEPQLHQTTTSSLELPLSLLCNTERTNAPIFRRSITTKPPLTPFCSGHTGMAFHCAVSSKMSGLAVTGYRVLA